MSAVLSPKVSPYDAITAQVIAAIEDGVERWQMPWHGGSTALMAPRNACTEMPYHGVNVVGLWAAAASKLYPSGYWASYEQWRRIGAQVRKGERASNIVFYKKLDGEPQSAEHDQTDAPRFVVRYSSVFNAYQVDGWDVPAPPVRSEVEVNAQVAAFVEATKAEVRHGGSRALYSEQHDCILVPRAEQFAATLTSTATEAYYATLLHELTHWTGAAHRLDRAKGKRFGDRGYAFEELVAELGSAFLCSAFQVANEPRPDHAAYVAHWLDILRADNRAIFAAASLAQQAVEYLRLLAGVTPP